MVKIYELKYDDFQGKEVVISIYDANETVQGAVTSIIGDVNPFIVNYNCDKNIITSNATLSIMSETDRQFEWMIDRDRFRWVIKVTKAASLIWEGYIDTESYEEDYGDTFNYFVTFQCNDGLGLLNRVRVDEIGLDFNNLVHPSVVLQKIAAFYSNLNTAISGNSSIQVLNPITSAFEEFLSTALVNPSGYIDEDGEYLFCDEVLESFLIPLNIKIYRDGTGLKYYNENDIRNNSPLVQGVDWNNEGKGQSMSIIPAINEQVVKYDNYRVSYLVKDTLSDGASFSESNQTSNGSNDGLAKYSLAKGWVIRNTNGHYFGRFISKDEKNNITVDGDGFHYIKNTNTNNDGSNNKVPAFTYVSDYPCYSCADGSVLKINATAKLLVKENLLVSKIILRCQLGFENNGESEFFSSWYGWRISDNNIIDLIFIPQNDENDISYTPNEDYKQLAEERFFECINNNIPISKNGNGKMTFQILESFKYFYGGSFANTGDYTKIKGVILKDFALEVTSNEGDNKATEYKMFDDALKYRDKKSTIVYCGTHQSGLELGQFLIKSKEANRPLHPAQYSPIKQIKYATDNKLYDSVEDYLLTSNYNQDSAARINLTNIIINTTAIYPNNIIKEYGYPTKTFKLMKLEKDYDKGQSKITIKEII